MIKILSEPPTWSTGIWWPGNETQKSTIFLQNRWRPEMSGAQWTDEGIRKNKQRAGSLQRQRSYTLLCVLNYRFKVQDFYSLTVEVPCCLVLIQSKQKQFSRVDLCSRVFGGIISSHMFEGFQRLWLSLLFSKKDEALSAISTVCCSNTAWLLHENDKHCSHMTERGRQMLFKMKCWI